MRGKKSKIGFIRLIKKKSKSQVPLSSKDWTNDQMNIKWHQLDSWKLLFNLYLISSIPRCPQIKWQCECLCISLSLAHTFITACRLVDILRTETLLEL